MKIGEGTKIHPLSNVYCKSVGNCCTIANFVEIGKDVVIGNFCSIQAFAFIPEGITLGNNVFIGPHVCFTNCRYPRGNEHKCIIDTMTNEPVVSIKDFSLEKTVVEDNVMIGAGSVIMCGITIGKDSVIGAGSTILRDVEPGSKIVQPPRQINLHRSSSRSSVSLLGSLDSSLYSSVLDTEARNKLKPS